MAEFSTHEHGETCNMATILKHQFQLKVINPDGSVDQDTGLIENVVTLYGIDTLMWGFSAFTGGPDAASGDKATHLGLGVGGGTSAYDDASLGSELGDGGYARDAFVTNVGTLEGSDRTVASTLVFTGTWAAGFVSATRLIDEIGVFNALTNGDLLAVTSFTEISVTTAQQVDATYTISLVQA